VTEASRAFLLQSFCFFFFFFFFLSPVSLLVLSISGGRATGAMECFLGSGWED